MQKTYQEWKQTGNSICLFGMLAEARCEELSPFSWSKLSGLRLLSLDMIVHQCHEFYRACAELDDAVEWLSQVDPPNKILDGRDADFFTLAIKGTAKLIETLGIEDGGFKYDVHVTLDHVESLSGGIWEGIFEVRADVLARDYRRIREGLFHEIEKHKFLYLPSQGVEYFAQDRLFGDAVYERFPSARQEIKEAGDALAFEMHTACVFHLMRAAEHGLRYLARRMKVKLLDKAQLMPLDFADWDKVIVGIRGEIANARKLARGPRKQQRLEMYSNAADHCEYMKDIWRNTASHARKPYERLEALSAMERVKNFMVFLAEALKTK